MLGDVKIGSLKMDFFSMEEVGAPFDELECLIII